MSLTARMIFVKENPLQLGCKYTYSIKIPYTIC